MSGPEQVCSISILDIDINNTTYKISKPHIQESLVQSIRKFGILQLPNLIRAGEKFIVLSGHNRLSVVKNLGYKTQTCIVHDAFNAETFFRRALLKIYHGEIGPISKIKLISILKQYSSDLDINVNEFALKSLSIPEYIISSEFIMQKCLAFSKSISDFLEMKEPGYKTIKDIALLPESFIIILGNWLETLPMRVNIFKQIVELLYDISRKGIGAENLQKITIPTEAEPRHKESWLLGSLLSIRYPDFSKRKYEADILLDTLRKNGIQPSFPEFFEGDEIGFTIHVRKKEGIASLYDKIEKIDSDIVNRLLDLL